MISGIAMVIFGGLLIPVLAVICLVKRARLTEINPMYLLVTILLFVYFLVRGFEKIST